MTWNRNASQFAYDEPALQVPPGYLASHRYKLPYFLNILWSFITSLLPVVSSAYAVLLYYFLNHSQFLRRC